MFQMKGQDKTPEKQLNEVVIHRLPEKEFRLMVVKMIQGLWKTMEKMQEMFTKDLEKLKTRQMNNTLKVKVAQPCLTLCDPMDYTVHGII